jgi:hypothetical protein
MQNIKTGKEEIIYLLSRAIDKYKTETGQQIVQNTNRKNYESLAIQLSEISNQLPLRYEEFGTEPYSPEINPKGQDYPHRKYDITGGQIKDALIGVVSNPRPFLVDACYIYLYGKGRKAFKLDPVDENLLEGSSQDKNADHPATGEQDKAFSQQISTLEHKNSQKRKLVKFLSVMTAILFAGLVASILFFINARQQWQSVKKDMNILPYKPGQAEIDSLEGVWLCYTGSPQARISDPSRYHKVVSNLVDVHYKNGYFTFDRYGASFNHVGYMQFEFPGIVSVYSRIKNNSNHTESPRHSLLNLFSGEKYLSAISASWNFDIGDKNKIIGIREVYIKLGKGGKIEEVINDVENASCQCKVIRWHQSDNQVKTFYLKNQLLDSLHIDELKSLIDEKSILPGVPGDKLVLDSSNLK